MQALRDKQVPERKYGPPSHIRPRQYNPMLELLEVQANSKLFSEYSQDVTNCLSILESTSAPNASMIDLQPEIQWFMRPFLLDFLIELHSSFKLQPQTLFLCLNIVDRYCSKRIVFKRHYQLVGCTALWIAGKYEDKKSRVPTLKELAMMCRNAYDEDMFIQMEMHILATLEWSLGHPNLEDCLQLAISACNITSHTTPCKYNSYPKNSSIISAVTAVGRFLCELSLYNKYFLSVPSSLVSITANLLACSMLQIPNASLQVQLLVNKVNDRKVDEDYDEDSENKVPNIDSPFLSGFDEQALNTIRKLATMFILQLSKVTEVLTKKHEELGVIQVINNFTSRFGHAIKVINQNETSIEESPVDAFQSGTFSYLADILLQLANSPSSVREEAQAPLTPPSASSQFSIFSENASYSYETPLKSAKYSSGYESISESSPAKEFANNHWSSPVPSKMHL